MTTDYQTNQKRTKIRRSLMQDGITYAMICSFLALVNYLTSPHYWWVLWVAGGWGIGLLLRTLFFATNLSDDE